MDAVIRTVSNLRVHDGVKRAAIEVLRAVSDAAVTVQQRDDGLALTWAGPPYRDCLVWYEGDDDVYMAVERRSLTHPELMISHRCTLPEDAAMLVNTAGRV